MRAIDADKLSPDCWTDEGKLAISQSQIASAKVLDTADILEENRILKNRCRVLTHGLICQSCKFKCDNRKRDFGDWSGIDGGEDVDKA